LGENVESRLLVGSAGGVIRALRKERGWSLAALAERVGWDKSRLSRYETNQVAMSLDTIGKIANGLELPALVVLIKCLKHVYPDLRRRHGRASKLLDEVAQQVMRDWDE